MESTLDQLPRDGIQVLGAYGNQEKGVLMSQLIRYSLAQRNLDHHPIQSWIRNCEVNGMIGGGIHKAQCQRWFSQE